MIPRELKAKWKFILRFLSYCDERGSTVDEFLGETLYVNSWAPSFTALRNAGLIEATGAFRDTRRGTPANVWRLTTAGWDELA